MERVQFIISKIVLLSSVTYLLSSATAEDGTEEFYTAAVYEHKVILPPITPVSRAEAVKLMMRNLEIFDDQTKKAASKGADIIVFPEDGIYGMRWLSRSIIRPYLEYIPPVNIKWNPCLEPALYKQTEVQNFLSCMARKSSIYVIANLGDKQPCEQDTDHLCPPDGQYQYNTDIVYDPFGNYVTKYHKYNLFYEFQFDQPASFEVISFPTPFGKFGLITCFDVLFQHPSLDLILKHNITDIAFPTAWMDAEPFLAAIQFHSSFALGLGINFLAANIHYPENRFHGSGIYTPNGAASFYYNNTYSSDGRLLISVIPVIEKSKSTHTQGKYFNKKETFPVSTTLKFTPDEFHQLLFHDNFTLIPLRAETGTTEICQNSLCCRLTYNGKRSKGIESKTPNSQTDFYAFAAFDGLHTYQGQYYIQVCTLVRCHGTNSRTCGQVKDTPFWEINSFTMHGNFSTPYIYPGVLLSENGSFQLPKYPNKWFYKDQVMRVQEPFESSLIVASMFGRVYERDPDVSNGI